jgi:hypothetical protein
MRRWRFHSVASSDLFSGARPLGGAAKIIAYYIIGRIVLSSEKL